MTRPRNTPPEFKTKKGLFGYEQARTELAIGQVLHVVAADARYQPAVLVRSVLQAALAGLGIEPSSMPLITLQEALQARLLLVYSNLEDEQFPSMTALRSGAADLLKLVTAEFAPDLLEDT